MKIRPIFLALLIAVACQCTTTEESGPDEQQQDILYFENNLKPSLMIDGREYTGQSIMSRMERFRVPGVSLAFFEKDSILWTRTYGYTDFTESKPIDEETRFQAASISKPVAASGMMKLVERGELDLDTDVNTYLTDLEMDDYPKPQTSDAPEKITLRRLVTHSAGLTVHGFRGYAEGEAVPSTLQVLNGEDPANSDPVVADTIPGSIWRYSGGGYTLMQYIIEENINPSFPEFMKEMVLDPAGMTRSTYEQPLPEDMRANTAIGHRQDGSEVQGKWHTYPEKAAAGLWTTPVDLARWAMALQRAYNGSENEFIQPETARQILTKNIGDWGLGPGLGGDGDSLVFRHGGANEGYRCVLMAYASDKRQGAVVMTNGDLGGPLMTEIMNAIDEQYGWNIYKPEIRSVIDVEPEDLAEYEGTYGDPNLRIEVYLEDEELKARIGENMFILYPEARDRFFDSQDVQTVNFFRDENDAVIGFEVNQRQFMKTE